MYRYLPSRCTCMLALRVHAVIHEHITTETQSCSCPCLPWRCRRFCWVCRSDDRAHTLQERPSKTCTQTHAMRCSRRTHLPQALTRFTHWSGCPHRSLWRTLRAARGHCNSRLCHRSIQMSENFLPERERFEETHRHAFQLVRHESRPQLFRGNKIFGTCVPEQKLIGVLHMGKVQALQADIWWNVYL